MRSHVRNLSAQIFKQAESMCLTPNWCPRWNTHEAFQIETVNIDVNFQFFFFLLFVVEKMKRAKNGENAIFQRLK